MNIYVFFGAWLILWVLCWWVAKNKYKVKQPIGVGWLASMFILVIAIYPIEFLLKEPTPEELQAQAQEAGDKYLIISQTDASQKTKCKLAEDALEKYNKIDDEHFIRIMKYSVKLECYPPYL